MSPAEVFAAFIVLFSLAAFVLYAIRRMNRVLKKQWRSKELLERDNKELRQVFARIFVVAALIAVGCLVWNLVTGSGLFYHIERVITDMNASWLEGEQKSCLYLKMPQEELGTISCSREVGPAFHNIPVKFSGMGPTQEELKNPIKAEWKCIREGDRFSCSESKKLPTE
jgi:hypothetical protein